MTDKDKIIVAFLVSIGIFSASQAAQYVSTLSAKEKSQIAVTAKKANNNILLCSGSSSFNSPVGGEGSDDSGTA